jgi:hypothetical protein
MNGRVNDAVRYEVLGDQVIGYDTDGFRVCAGDAASQYEADGNTVTFTVTAEMQPVPRIKYGGYGAIIA